MELIKRQKLYTFVILLISVAMVLLLTWFNQQTLKAQQESDALWQNYIKQEAQINSSLNNLYQAIGYEGFIHHYKNYIIRQTPGLREQLRLDSINIRQELKNLETHLTKAEELAVLDQLDYIFGRYIGFVDEISRLIAANESIKDIDRLVKINEPTALLAFKTLNSSLQYRLKETRNEAKKQLQTSRWLAIINFLLILPILIIVGYVIYLFKASEKLLIESNQAKDNLNQLLDTTPDPMLFSDLSGRIVRANQSAIDWLGYSEQQLKTMDIEQLIAQSTREQHVRLRKQFQIDPQARPMNKGHPVSIFKANGEEAKVQIHLGYWKHPTNSLIIASIRDVTQEMMDRESLRKSHRELATTVQKLQHVTHHLAESEKMAALGTLVAGVSHEINTPLGVSISAITHMHDQTEALKSDFLSDKLTFEKLEEHLNTQLETSNLITRNLQHAAVLINNFKQVAIDQSQNEIRQFKFCEYVNDALTSLKPSFKHKSIELRIDCETDQTITSYPGALSQVINNLVMNAVQHAFPNEAKGMITVQSLFDSKQQTVTLRVSDNGIGMNDATLKHIFEPFFTTARTEGGSGLGMNIVYNLVTQLLQGTIQVESEYQHGTDIFITVPTQLDTSQKLNQNISLLSELKTPD